MNCTINDFKDNVTKQMLQYGYGVAAVEYTDDVTLQNTIRKWGSTNQISGPSNTDNKKIAEKIADSINKKWNSLVANVQLSNNVYSIGINISPDMMKVLVASDFTAQERKSINNIAPGYANSLEEEAILKYENMKTSDIDKLVSAQANNFLTSVLDTLQRAFPTINYQVVSDADAREITKSAANPYTGQGVSFFYKGTVYIISGNVTPETLIHEFLHPLIKSIEEENPGLFDNLFEESKSVDATYELGVEKRLQNEIDNDPNAYSFDTNAYKREYITRVLENVARERLLENKEDGILYNFVNKIFYALKQLFRKIFGSKINISKLSPYTSLSDLAEMLKMSEFNLNAELFTTQDYVEYLTKVQEEIEKTAKLISDATVYNKEAAKNPENVKFGLSNLEDFLKVLTSLVNSNAEYFTNNSMIDPDLAAIIFNSETGNLEKIKQEIALDRKYVIEEQLELADEIREALNIEKNDAQKAYRLMSSMLEMQALVNNLAGPDKTVLIDKTSSDDFRQNLVLIDKLESMLKSFETLARSLNKIIVSIDPKNSIAQSLNETIVNAQNGQKQLKDQRFKNIKDVIYMTVSTVNDSITSLYNDAINKIEEEIAAKGSNPLLESRKAYYIKTRDQLLISEQKMEDLLSGKAGDSNFLEGYVLSAIQSSDPVYGTLGSIVKNAYNNVEANMVGVYTNYFEKLNELQSKAGITKYNYSNKYRQIITKGTRLVKSVEEGDEGREIELEEKSDYYEFLHSTLVSKATNDLRRLEAEQEQARRNKDLNLEVEKAREISELKDKYFFGSVLSGHSTRKQMLATDWGKRIFIKRLAIEDKISTLQLAIKVEQGIDSPESKDNILQYQEDIEQQYILLNEVTSLRKRNGELKEGQDYEDAKEYKNFYTITENTLEIEREETIEKFAEAYKLNEQLLGANSPEFSQWLAENTYIKRKDEYFALVQQIFSNIENTNNKSASFTSKLKELNARRSELGKTLSELRILYSDPRSKMMLIDLMTPEAIAKVNAVENELFRINIEIDIERGLPKNISEKDIELLHTVRKLYAGDFEYESEEPPANKSLKQTNFALYEKYINISEALKEFRSKQPSNAEQEYINGEWSKFYDIQYKGKTAAYEIYRKEAIQNINNGKYVDIAFISTDNNFIKALKNKDFKKFIDDHHTKYEVSEGGKVSFAYVPNGVHMEQKINDNYKDMIEFRNSKGELIRTNFPSRNYHKVTIKEELKTPRIMGVTINAFGEWLPKPIEVLYAESKGKKITEEFLTNIPDLSDSEYQSFMNSETDLTKYVNTDYYNLKRTDRPLWDLLEYIKSMSFKQQKETSKLGRLNFQVPSFFESNFEAAQKTLSGHTRSGFSSFLSSVKAKLYGKTGDEAEEGFSNITSAETEEEKRTRLKLVSLDFFGDELSKIPVAGKYPIELDKVSMDIPYSMFRYFYSIEEVKEKVKIMPIAKGLEKVLADDENVLKEVDKINKYAFLENNLTIFAGAKNKKEASIRRQMVESFNRTIFEGENTRGFLSDNHMLLKAVNSLTRFTSTVFLSTPESAIRNRVQMGMQNIINLAAQDGVDKKSYSQGEAWAIKYMFGQTTHAYQGGTYTAEQMLVDAFDPKQGSSKQRIGRSFNRSYTQDAADWQSFVLAPRTWLETQGAIKLWAQRMYYEKVKIVTNGVESEIPYMEAWEIKDGKLSLRSGIDQTYDVGGVKFNLIKNRIHQQIALTNGDSSALGKSYGDKFVIYNQVLSMKRFFYMMFMNRFGSSFKYNKEKSFFDAWSFSPRINYATGDVQEGYYITSLRFIANYFKNIFTKNPNFNIYWSTLTPYEKRNLIKTFTDVMIALVLWLTSRMLFEYDPDDEDRYKKLRAKSAPLPFFGTADEGEFHLDGYAFNKALQLILGFQQEHNTFMPLPGMGMQTYTSIFQVKMATLQPSVDLISKSLTYGILAAVGDERGFYDKRVGPYEWQQKDSAKIANLWLKFLGFSGTTTDAILDIQTKESFSRL